MRLAPLLLALLAFTGCTLIDRRTFAPAPEAKAQVPTPPPAAIDPRTPLVTIEYTVAAPDYQDLLNAAVRAAEARDAQVQFDVISVMKDTSDVTSGMQRATDVMRAIMRNRVPADRIHLGVRTDPLLTSPQVRVYVR
ncbi:MAG TPA: hypothetical protein VHB27_07420 [Rhodopila sp.]|uniref:hypothetical protein n=1 Tax=Rhodopila sp. TaxID=2480087 RepID=UPI002C66DB60|nr:hypothetical protein [Rhodopila sp.]HVY15039.1 hypothetical protein [Rhodopila sp.]